MEVRYGTQVFFGLASKEEEPINFLRDLLASHSEGSYNAFLTELNDGESVGIQFDGEIQHDRIKIYERILPKKNAASEEWHYIIFEFNAKGYVSSDLRSTTMRVLNKRFGANKVKFYYFDEYRKVNSDEEGIIFPRRIKVDFSLLGYPWVRTEFYHSVEEMLENPMYASSGLDDVYEMSPDEVTEVEEKIEEENGDLFTIEITAYRYGYEAASNAEISKFHEIFD